MATHSSILAWRIPWTEDPDRLYSPWGPKELDIANMFTLLLFRNQNGTAFLSSNSRN